MKQFIRSHFSNKSRQGSRSKYMPHQSMQEIIRRTGFLERCAYGKKWHVPKAVYANWDWGFKGKARRAT